MSGNPENVALVERLRADLTKAEEEFRQATTPESKQQTLECLDQALARYSDVMLRHKPKSASGSA